MCLTVSNKLAYSGHQELPTCPDAVASGLPALRALTSDPQTLPGIFSLRSLRALENPELAEGERARELIYE